MRLKLTQSDYEQVKAVIGYPRDTWELGLKCSTLSAVARNCLTELIAGRLTTRELLQAGGEPGSHTAGQKLTKSQIAALYRYRGGPTYVHGEVLKKFPI